MPLNRKGLKLGDVITDAEYIRIQSMRPAWIVIQPGNDPVVKYIGSFTKRLGQEEFILEPPKECLEFEVTDDHPHLRKATVDEHSLIVLAHY